MPPPSVSSWLVGSRLILIYIETHQQRMMIRCKKRQVPKDSFRKILMPTQGHHNSIKTFNNLRLSHSPFPSELGTIKSQINDYSQSLAKIGNMIRGPWSSPNFFRRGQNFIHVSDQSQGSLRRVFEALKERPEPELQGGVYFSVDTGDSLGFKEVEQNQLEHRYDI